MQNRKRTPRQGFILIVLAVLAVTLIGMIGLAADVGRALVVRNELIAFADAAAMAAAYELDGTAAGITSSNSVASTGPGTNRWHFGTQTVSTSQVTFASSFGGNFKAAGSAPADSRFVRVQVSGVLPLYFLRVIPGIPATVEIQARATAGQGVVNSPAAGLDPFSPDAVSPADLANFGYTEGSEYDIKWAPNGQRNKPGGKCQGDIDANIDPGGGASDRGYINLGQGNGNSDLFNGIVNNDFGSAPVNLTLGTAINTVNGNKNVGPALSARMAQDTDQSSANGSAYHGNGRRILVLAVNDRSAAGLVIGYAAFLLPVSTPCLTNNNKACCAIYLGPAVLGGSRRGAGPPGKLYAVKLFE